MTKEAIDNIIEDLKSGKLNRSIDEKYRGGFWDLAGNIVSDYYVPDIDSEELQNDIYEVFYLIAEKCLNKDFG